MWGPILKTLHYAFSVNQPVNQGETARRSGFMQFQTYPENNLIGGGQFHGSFNAYQAQQAMVNFTPVTADPFRGGQIAGSIVMQPLIDTTQSGG